VKKDISGDRGVFQNTCNTYDMEDTGFSYTTFLRRMLCTKDIERLLNSKTSQQELHFGNGNRKRMDIRLVDNRNDYVQFQLNVGEPCRFFETGYWFSLGRLNRIAMQVPEISIPVAGFTIEAKSNDMPNGYLITQLPAKYHKGGRAFNVNFEEIVLGKFSVDLPKNIEVTTQQSPPPSDSSKLLRNARLFNYQLTSEPVSTSELGRRFLAAPFFQDEQKFRQLSVKYWLKPSDSIPEEDREWLVQFADSCCERLENENRISYKLQLLYMSMSSDLMCGNRVRIENSLLQYGTILREAGLEYIAEIGLQQFRDLWNSWNNSDIP
jgi:hypothetical protein